NDPYDTAFDNILSVTTVASRERTDGVVVAPFFGPGNANAILTVNTGSNSFGLLQNQTPYDSTTQVIGASSFLNPLINTRDTPAVPTPFPPPLGFSPSAVAWGYFDADLNPDIALLDSVSGAIHLYLGEGNGHFTVGAAIPLPPGSAPTGLSYGIIGTANGQA